MPTRDDDDTMMWIDQALDGEPGAPALDGAALSAEQAAERRRLERLQSELAGLRISARPGFAAAVMASLPEPAWATRRAGGFRGALVALAALAAAAVLLLGNGYQVYDETGVVFGAVQAVIEFGIATTLSGAGLLAASWRGVGLALGEALDVSQTVVFGLGVVGLNALLFLLLRRRGRRRAHAEAAVRSRD